MNYYIIYIINKYLNPFKYYVSNYHNSTNQRQFLLIYISLYIFSIYGNLYHGQCRTTLSGLDILIVNGDRGSTAWSLHPNIDHKFCWLIT